jgi:hypothetical protein
MICGFMSFVIKTYSQTIWTGPDVTFSKPGNSDWTLETNQDRLTNNVWITHQNNKPIYNYKWWQDNFGTDATVADLNFDFWNSDWEGPTSQTFTVTGGTKGIRWTLLDDTSSTEDWSGYNFGTLGNPANYYSLNNIIVILEILNNPIYSGDYSTINVINDFEVEFNGLTFSSACIGQHIVGKKLGVWLIEDDIYFTLTFNSWGQGGSGGSFSYTRSSDPALNLNELDTNGNSKVLLYPNPAQEFIKFSGIDKSSQYNIYNILGSKIASGIISDNEALEISLLDKGLYLMTFDNGAVLKFIKE